LKTEQGEAEEKKINEEEEEEKDDELLEELTWGTPRPKWYNRPRLKSA
jgi:hypothetical protein